MELETLNQEVRSGWQDAIIAGWNDKDPHVVAVRNKFKTACWVWDFSRARHSVFVGEYAPGNADTNLSSITYYIQSYLYHELAHARWTSRDLKAAGQWCAENRVPFALLNLAEDARIEYLWRLETERPFLWAKYEALELGSTPESHLFYLIQTEGKRSRAVKIDKKVRRFYNRFVKAESTEDLYPILLAWLKAYPQSAETPKYDEEEKEDSASGGGESEGEGKSEGMGEGDKERKLDTSLPPEVRANEAASNGENRAGDMAAAVELQSDAEAMQEALDASVIVADNSDEGGIPCKVPAAPESVQVKEYSNVDPEDILSGSNEYDRKLVQVMANRMDKVFVSKSRKINTSNPSKRLNIRGSLSSSPKHYRAKKEPAARKAKTNVFVDLSGSMSGVPSHAARVIVAVFSELARRGRIEGNLVLNTGRNYRGMVCTFALPVEDDVIMGLEGWGSFENFKGAFDFTLKMMKEAKYNICITDGDIVDSPVDKARLRRQGVYTYGIYVGHYAQNEELLTWFEQAVSRETIEHAVDELTRKLAA